MGYNEVTKGRAKVGGLAFSDGSVGLRAQSGTISRTNTSDTNLFVLPPDATIITLIVSGTVASNAGTSAVIDVGPAGSDTAYLSGFSVVTDGDGTFIPATQDVVTTGNSAVQVVGKYAETGTASTTGGPWTVTVLYTA